MSNKFEKIGTSIPLNKEAALVVGKGEHFKHTIKDFVSQKPLPYVTALPQMCQRWNKQAKEKFNRLVGLKIDRITILGREELPFKKTKHGSTFFKWIGRCVCGNYVKVGLGMQKSISRNTHIGKKYMCAECFDKRKMQEGFK